MEKFFPPLEASSAMLADSVRAMAIIAKRGRPTPVIQKPKVAKATVFPAFCPRDTGKIKLPAPNNIPKRREAIKRSSRPLTFFFIG